MTTPKAPPTLAQRNTEAAESIARFLEAWNHRPEVTKRADIIYSLGVFPHEDEPRDLLASDIAALVAARPCRGCRRPLNEQYRIFANPPHPAYCDGCLSDLQSEQHAAADIDPWDI